MLAIKETVVWVKYVRQIGCNIIMRVLTYGSHTAYLVFDGAIFVGASGVSYFQMMPTYHNPSGCKAYIMNLYTKPEYRRKGIENNTLKFL